MSKDEILEKLIKDGIIVHIFDEYELTDKLIRLQTSAEMNNKSLALGSFKPTKTVSKSEKKDTYVEAIQKEKASEVSEWPASIAMSKNRVMFKALIEAANIPQYSSDGQYRLWGSTIGSIDILQDIVRDPKIKPGVFIAALSDYYEYTERPRALKNLLVSGEILDIYEEQLSEGPKNKKGGAQWS